MLATKELISSERALDVLLTFPESLSPPYPEFLLAKSVQAHQVSSHVWNCELRRVTGPLVLIDWFLSNYNNSADPHDMIVVVGHHELVLTRCILFSTDITVITDNMGVIDQICMYISDYAVC